MSHPSQRNIQAPERTGARPGAGLFAAAAAMCAILVGSACGPLPPAAPPVPPAVDPGAARPVDPGAALPVDPGAALRVTFLDVGQGDAVLLQAPEGQTALVDAGRHDVSPLLRELGVERIDLLVATHPHADHIGGMAQVVESMPVRSFMDNGDPHTTETYRRLMSALDARPGITYLEASPRTISLGSARIEVLPLLPAGTADHNNRSVALVVRFGRFTAFLSGDSETPQLTDLVDRSVVPKMTLLKAAHHGADNGFTPEFLQAGRPEVVVISVGSNSYGHPRPAALRAYAEIGASVLRTDLDGHVAVHGSRDGRFRVASAEELAALGSPRALGRERIRAGEAAGPGAVVAGGGAARAPAGARVEVSVHADAPGDDHQNPNGEYATLANRGASDLAIGGWTLCDAAGACFAFRRVRC